MVQRLLGDEQPSIDRRADLDRSRETLLAKAGGIVAVVILFLQKQGTRVEGAEQQPDLSLSPPRSKNRRFFKLRLRLSAGAGRKKTSSRKAASENDCACRQISPVRQVVGVAVQIGVVQIEPPLARDFPAW